MENNNLEMFCLTLEPKHIEFIKKLNYTPVGLGEQNFPKDCISDKSGENISKKKQILWRVYFPLLVMEKLFYKY